VRRRGVGGVVVIRRKVVREDRREQLRVVGGRQGFPRLAARRELAELRGEMCGCAAAP
jgi:hypothetical protein